MGDVEEKRRVSPPADGAAVVRGCEPNAEPQESEWQRLLFPYHTACGAAYEERGDADAEIELAPFWERLLLEIASGSAAGATVGGRFGKISQLAGASVAKRVGGVGRSHGPKPFSADFKKRAVAASDEPAKSLPEVARETGVSRSALDRWRAKAKAAEPGRSDKTSGRKSRFTREEKIQALDRIEGGEDMNHVAKDLGVHRSLFSHWFKKLKRRAPRLVRKSRFTQEQKLKAIHRIEGGEQAKDVAKDLGVSKSLMSQWKREMRPHGSGAKHSRRRLPK